MPNARSLPNSSNTERKILISPGYGAGWSTWIGSTRAHKAFALFDEKLIAAVEAGRDLGYDEDPKSPLGDFVRRFEKAFPDEAGGVYTGGARNLQVEIVHGQFMVDEYDGSESLTLRDDESKWF